MRRPRENSESSRATVVPSVRCAIYTRKSTEEGLEQAFNTLDAQRESAEAYIRSQQQEGWTVLAAHYDDGGYSGANMERPALTRLLDDVRSGVVQCVVVYKVDRLTRSLLDFARIVEVLDQQGVSFVSVTQQFNTTGSLGRLTLNILLSFAQFEREMIAERTRDKMSAARKKGKWVGGNPVLGYDVSPKGGSLIVNEAEAERVRAIFAFYLEYGSLLPVIEELDRRGWCMKEWTTRKGKTAGGKPFAKNRLYNLLTNVIYTGKIAHQGKIYDGEQPQIVDSGVWNTVQERLKSNGQTGSREIRNKYGALLKGMLTCGTCDVAMIHTYTKKAANKLYRYYVCVKAHQGGWNKCETRSIAAPEIEEAVVDQIRGIGANSALLDEVVRQLEEQRETHAGALERERRFIERDLKRLAEEMPGITTGSGAATRLAEAMERTESLGRRLSEIRGHLAALDGDPISRAEVEQALRGFDGLWRQMTPREQERFVKLIVEQVRYNGKTGVVTVDFRSAGIRQLCVDGNRPQ